MPKNKKKEVVESSSSEEEEDEIEDIEPARFNLGDQWAMKHCLARLRLIVALLRVCARRSQCALQWGPTRTALLHPGMACARSRHAASVTCSMPGWQVARLAPSVPP